MNIKSMLVILLIATGLAACSKKEDDAPALPAASTPPVAGKVSVRPFSAESIARGAAVFQRRCAECHGPGAQGHPDWRPKRDDKLVVAPPLNGSGPAARRKKAELKKIITEGISLGGIPVMPRWNGRLNEGDIDDVITWFQALWPPEVYERWSKAQIAKPKVAKVVQPSPAPVKPKPVTKKALIKPAAVTKAAPMVEPESQGVVEDKAPSAETAADAPSAAEASFPETETGIVPGTPEEPKPQVQ